MGNALGDGRRALSKEVPVGYKRTEVGVIPEEWSFQSLGTICDVRDGTHESPRFYSEGVPFVTSKNIVNGSLDLENTSYISEQDANEINKRSKVDPNDILMSMIGTIGSAVLIDFEPSFCIKNVALIKPQEVLPKFLIQLIVSPLFQNYLKDSLDGGIQKFVALGTLRHLNVPLPSSSEQRAIAEALSDVDELLGSLEKLIAKKRAIKQAAMQQLLTGKTRLPEFSGKWEMKRIGDISDVDPENLPSGTSPDFTFNYISLEQVDAGRLLGYLQVKFCTAPSRARRVLRYGDVLMSTVRPGLMAHLLYREQIPNAVCSTGFAVLRAKPQLSDPGFLFAHLLGHVVNKQIEKTLAGSNYPAINGRDVRLLEIPCPPQIHEQRAIAAVLSDMDDEITALERRRDKTHAIKQGMMQQLLTGRVRLVKSE